MRPIKIIGYLNDKSNGGSEVEFETDGKRLAIHQSAKGLCVQRFEKGTWVIVAERLSEAASEAYFPPGWTHQKFTILVTGFLQGRQYAMQKDMARMIQGMGAPRVNPRPPKTPLQIRARLALEKARRVIGA